MQKLSSRGFSHTLKALLLILSILALNGCGGTLGGAPDTSAIGTANGGVDLDVRVPKSLVFSVQPTAVKAGKTFSPSVTVQALAENGTPMTDVTGNVVVSIATNPGGGALKGTLSVALNKGQATFSDLKVDKHGVGYVFNASLLTVKNTTLSVDSNAFNVGRSVPAGNVSNVSWKSIGPDGVLAGGGPLQQPIVSGRAVALVVSPDGKTIFLGSAGGGVWKTVDAGSSWAPLTDSQTFSAIGSLALDPNDTNVMYVGTGEAKPIRNSLWGDGIYKTSDGGSTFQKLAGSDVFTRNAISDIIVSRQDSNTIFAGLYPPTNFKTMDWGVFRSKDGGATFTNVTQTSIGGRAAICDMTSVPASNGGNPDILFACVDGNYTADGLGPKGSAGLWTSANNGDTWTHVTNGLPTSDQIGRLMVVSAPSHPDIMYAWIGKAPSGSGRGGLLGLWASKDRGLTWAKITMNNYPAAVTFTINGSQQNVFEGQSDYNIALAVDPNSSTTVYAGLVQPLRVDGINLNANTGNTTFLGGSHYVSDSTHPHVDQHAFLLAPNHTNPAGSASLYTACDGGLWRLDSPLLAAQSTTWQDLNANLATLQFRSVATGGPSTSTLGGTQDNGTSLFLDQPAWTFIKGGDGGPCFVDQADDKVAGFSSQADPDPTFVPYEEVFPKGRVDLLSGGFDYTDFDTSKGMTLMFPPCVLHQDDPKRTVALGTFQVWETTQNDFTARAWQSYPLPGVDRTKEVVASLDYGVDQGTMYVVTTAGRIFVRSSVGGAFADVSASVPNLQLVAEFAFAAGGFYPSVAVDRSDETGKTAYIGTNVFTEGNGLHVFKTTNRGGTWTDISSNLPDIPVNALVVDPSGTVFAGTDNGIYALPTSTSTWSAVNTGLPTVQVRGFDVSPKRNVIVAATYGRGVFVSQTTGQGTKQALPAKMLDAFMDIPRMLGVPVQRFEAVR